MTRLFQPGLQVRGFAIVFSYRRGTTKGTDMDGQGISGRTWVRVFCLLVLLACNALHAQDTVTYVYTDPNGTPLAEADTHGNITKTYDYTPYGTVALGSPPNGPGYTGHVNDSETNLVYMQARYYDPATGQFLSVDPESPAAGNISNFNRYVYVGNNPINHIDPNGREAACVSSASHCDPDKAPPPPVFAVNAVISSANFISEFNDQFVTHLIGANPLIGEEASGALKGLSTALEGVAGAERVTPLIVKAGEEVPAPEVKAVYSRPSGIPTTAQRASVQGKACVDCGKLTAKQVADHKTPMVVEHYTTGSVDLQRAKSLDAVQPQCPTCSARQGADMSRYSRQMKQALNDRNAGGN